MEREGGREGLENEEKYATLLEEVHPLINT